MKKLIVIFMLVAFLSTSFRVYSKENNIDINKEEFGVLLLLMLNKKAPVGLKKQRSQKKIEKQLFEKEFKNDFQKTSN